MTHQDAGVVARILRLEDVALAAREALWDLRASCVGSGPRGRLVGLERALMAAGFIPPSPAAPDPNVPTGRPEAAGVPDLSKDWPNAWADFTRWPARLTASAASLHLEEAATLRVGDGRGLKVPLGRMTTALMETLRVVCELDLADDLAEWVADGLPVRVWPPPSPSSVPSPTRSLSP